MKTLSLLILSLVLFVSKEKFNLSDKTSVIIDSTLLRLKKKEAYIDQYAQKHYKDLIVFVKLEGKKNLVRIKKGDLPETTDYIYNIVKGQDGKIIMIYEVPYSQSGDWYVEIKHYFNDDGKTFAFTERETVFDDSIKGGLAEQGFYKYYDDRFKLITQFYQLIDAKRKSIKRNKKEFNFRYQKYKIYKNVNECLQAYNIKL